MFNKIKIGEGTEVDAFLRGRKRGLIISENAFKTEQRLKNFYFHEKEYISGNIFVGVFHRKHDMEFFRDSAKSYCDIGRILGYPPKAYKKFENTFDRSFSEKLILDYFGVQFVCLKEDYEDCLKWLKINAKPRSYRRRYEYA